MTASVLDDENGMVGLGLGEKSGVGYIYTSRRENNTGRRLMRETYFLGHEPDQQHENPGASDSRDCRQAST